MAGRGKNGSDAELREAVIAGWHRLETRVRSNPDRLAGLAKLTGLPFRQLDMARRVRNQIAHPDGPVPRDRLLAALRIIAAAEQQLQVRKRTPSRRGRSTPRRPNQAARTKRSTRPAAPTNRRNALIAVGVLGVAAVVLLVVLYLPI